MVLIFSIYLYFVKEGVFGFQVFISVISKFCLRYYDMIFLKKQG